MIEIRAATKWKPVSREKALSFARWLLRNMVNGGSAKERLEKINSRHVRGIRFTLDELQG